jgi:hypothetical protein
MTTFGDQVKQFGGVPVGGGMLPLMGRDAKAFFVDPAVGNDSNSGLTPAQALDTVSAAYAKTVDKRGDVIYLMNDGTTGGTSREDTLITWSNNNTHLVGLCAPVGISQRSRIVPNSSKVLTAAAMIRVTGSGNSFRNVQIANFGADTDGIAARGVDVTGHRNYFYNCHIVGVGGSNVGDEANAVDLLISAGEENVFERCTIGADTVTRSTTNACVELVSAATRNMFIDCLLNITTDAATPLFVKADGAGDLDRWVIFKNCVFHNAVESTATALTAAVNAHNDAGGTVVLQSCTIIGATDVAAADNGNVYTSPIAAAGTGGLGTIVTR